MWPLHTSEALTPLFVALAPNSFYQMCGPCTGPCPRKMSLFGHLSGSLKKINYPEGLTQSLLPWTAQEKHFVKFLKVSKTNFVKSRFKVSVKGLYLIFITLAFAGMIDRWSLGHIFLLVAVGVVQLVVLRRLFESKPTSTSHKFAARAQMNLFLLHCASSLYLYIIIN